VNPPLSRPEAGSGFGLRKKELPLKDWPRLARINRIYMKKLALSLAAVGLIVTGCVVTSVHPFYLEKDVVSGEPLLGHWKNPKEAGEHWIFEPGAQKSLKLTYVSGTETNLVSAHLFKFGQETFLDLFPLKPDAPGFPPAIPSHLLLRVNQLQPTLKMTVLNHDWLVKLVQQQPKTIAHLIIRDPDESDKVRVVLTAETSELQQFIRKQLNNAETWGDASELQHD